MTVKLREGGVYLTRDGKKVGPMRKKINGDDPFPWTDKPLGSGYIQNDGWLSNGYWTTAGGTPLDLVSEVTAPSPVRKVTRTEIVPGTYGDIKVVDGVDCKFIRIKDDYINLRAGNISRLRAAASIFTELADALDAMAEEEK